MCGIAGFVSTSHDPGGLPLLQKMMGTLIHRGPDGSGWYVSTPSGGQKLQIQDQARTLSAAPRSPWVGLGHRRLSIIDHSQAGFQPLSNETDDVFLICNGEIYNYVSLRDELIARGHSFKSHSDSEVILHLYEEWGPEGVQRLKGMYAFALWDSKKKRLLLHRDRYGEKPLYYRIAGDAIYFASELKSLEITPGFKNHTHPAAVESFFAYGHVLPPLTWYSEVKKLIGSELLIFEQGRAQIELTWTPSPIRRGSGALDECFSEFDSTFSRVIQQATITDGITCALPLSGGIDSTLLALYMSDQNQPFTKFTMRAQGNLDEFERALLVHRATRGEHVVLDQDEATDSPFELLSWVDEPIASVADISLRSRLYSRIAKSTKVAITGGAADHVFLNGQRYQTAMQYDSGILQAKLPLLKRLKSKLKAFRASDHLIDRHRSYLVPFQGLLKPSVQSEWETIFENAFEKIHPQDLVSTTQRMTIAFDRQHIQYLDDLMAMRSGLEARDPFLHVDLQALVAHLPLEILWPGLRDESYRTNDPRTKFLLRQAIQRKSQGKLSAVAQGTKVNWGSGKDQVNQTAVKISLPGAEQDLTQNAALMESCHLNPDQVRKIAQRDPSDLALSRLATLNLWLRSRDESRLGPEPHPRRES